ncbi:MAG: hypothetical protein NW215_00715 [Hyphomicrobiales bacterium]|nr:hypothetical protein [Hyphomicrobiales bacterium]
MNAFIVFIYLINYFIILAGVAVSFFYPRFDWLLAIVLIVGLVSCSLLRHVLEYPRHWRVRNVRGAFGMAISQVAAAIFLTVFVHGAGVAAGRVAGATGITPPAESMAWWLAMRKVLAESVRLSSGAL